MSVIYGSLILYARPDTSLRSLLTLVLLRGYSWSQRKTALQFVHHTPSASSSSNIPFLTSTTCKSHPERGKLVSFYRAVVSLHSLRPAGICYLDNTWRGCWTMTWLRKDNWVHLDIPQQMWGRQSIDRGPLVLLVINRQSMGDSALFRYKWGLLNGTAMTGYACVKTKPQAEEKK